MARIRSIKPEFWTDEKVVALSPLARLLFVGLWNFVDDEGRGEFSPTRLKMQILPADSADISELLGEIRGKELVQVYSVDAKEYFQVVGFTKHQKIDKRTRSKFPPPSPTSTEFPRIPSLDQGKEGKGKDQGEEKEKRASALNGDAPYAYAGKVVKLNRRDLQAWKEAYEHLSLMAELIARDAWLAEQSASVQKTWFQSTASYLAKKNREARAAIETAAVAGDGVEMYRAPNGELRPTNRG